MARELSPYNIRVNVLQPGHIATAVEVEAGHTPGSDARKVGGAGALVGCPCEPPVNHRSCNHGEHGRAHPPTCTLPLARNCSRAPNARVLTLPNTHTLPARGWADTTKACHVVFVYG